MNRTKDFFFGKIEKKNKTWIFLEKNTNNKIDNVSYRYIMANSTL